MSEEKALKKIGTIFDDFKCNTNILSAKIEKVNLYKKTNCFEVYLISEKIINIKEMKIDKSKIKSVRVKKGDTSRYQRTTNWAIENMLTYDKTSVVITTKTRLPGS